MALHLLDERPEQARPALEAINEASEEALAELHSVLDMLSRGLGEDGAHGESGAWAPHVPTAGLRDLDGLMRRTRAAGLDVRLAIEGEARSVPAGVDLAALRIVQEALTNVVRHAGGAQATVRLVYTLRAGRAGRRRRPGRRPGGARVEDGGQECGPWPRRHAGAGPCSGRHVRGRPRPGRGYRVRAQFPLQDGAR